MESIPSALRLQSPSAPEVTVCRSLGVGLASGSRLARQIQSFVRQPDLIARLSGLASPEDLMGIGESDALHAGPQFRALAHSAELFPRRAVQGIQKHGLGIAVLHVLDAGSGSCAPESARAPDLDPVRGQVAGAAEPRRADERMCEQRRESMQGLPVGRRAPQTAAQYAGGQSRRAFALGKHGKPRDLYCSSYLAIPCCATTTRNLPSTSSSPCRLVEPLERTRRMRSPLPSRRRVLHATPSESPPPAARQLVCLRGATPPGQLRTVLRATRQREARRRTPIWI